MSGTESRVGPWRLAVALVVVTAVLLVFGSTVRVHGAGLACPDWPLCFGELVPRLDFRIFLEWGHRVLASGVSLGFLAVVVGAWRDPGAWLRVRGWLLAGAVLLAAQVVLGGLTVLHLLAEWTVTSHLLVGNAFCASLYLVARRLSGQLPGGGDRRAVLVTGSVLALVGVQMALGGLVASSGAGLACGPTFPGCGGSQWIPSLSGLVGVQVAHRIVGVTLLVSAGVGAILARGTGAAGAAATVAAVVAAQAALGITNVLTMLPVEVTILHSAGAAATVLASVRAVDVARCGRRARVEGFVPADRGAPIGDGVGA